MHTVQGDASGSRFMVGFHVLYGGRWYGIDANPHLLCNWRRGPQVLQAPTDAERGHGVREW